MQIVECNKFQFNGKRGWSIIFKENAEAKQTVQRIVEGEAMFLKTAPKAIFVKSINDELTQVKYTMGDSKKEVKVSMEHFLKNLIKI